MTDLELPAAGLDPLELYAAALDGTALYRRTSDGRLQSIPTRTWLGGLQPGDESLLGRCLGPTLDIGCGPGRLTVALQQRGHVALGIDISSRALALARSAGAQVLARDVYGDVPGVGRWTRILLADGNVGIGGDVTRLLARCAELLQPDGVVFLELPTAPAATCAPGDDTIRLEDAAGRVSSWFPWSEPDAAEVRRIASGTGLRQVAAWSAAGRSFLGLARRVAPGL